ncbi:MAG: hypothetical protein QM232_04600 [Bacteroidota bacterium]|nr:hypothetical protein [Bacteroidota bacterium]
MFSDQLKRILKKFRSEKISTRIEEGKQVFFENTHESIAIRFVPGLQGRPGRYFAKHFGRDEYEVESNASAVVMGIMEGKPISVTRYRRYHLISSSYWTKFHYDDYTTRDYEFALRAHQMNS